MNLLTVKEAASTLRISRETVLKMLNSGRIEGYRVGENGGAWRIPEQAMFDALRHRPGEKSDPMPRPKRSGLEEKVVALEARRRAS